MKRFCLSIVVIALALTALGGGSSSAQNQDSNDQSDDQAGQVHSEVPGGLAFSEFKGHEIWQVSLTAASNVIRAIVANPVMIQAYQQGVPANGKPLPDGSEMRRWCGHRKT